MKTIRGRLLAGCSFVGGDKLRRDRMAAGIDNGDKREPKQVFILGIKTTGRDTEPGKR